MCMSSIVSEIVILFHTSSCNFSILFIDCDSFSADGVTYLLFTVSFDSNTSDGGRTKLSLTWYIPNMLLILHKSFEWCYRLHNKTQTVNVVYLLSYPVCCPFYVFADHSGRVWDKGRYLICSALSQFWNNDIANLNVHQNGLGECVWESGVGGGV